MAFLLRRFKTLGMLALLSGALSMLAVLIYAVVTYWDREALPRDFRDAYANDLNFLGDAFWEYGFLRGYKAGFFRDFGWSETDALRGWKPRPNFMRPNGKGRITNDRGQRCPNDYVYRPDKITVMVLGDSFTFGDADSDEAVWPIVLQGKDAKLHVVNLAVSGYGLDQMYLTQRELIDEYKPQWVVAAYIDEDLSRTLLGFREHRKPRFVIQPDGELKLTNTPIGDRQETYDWLLHKYGATGWRKTAVRENKGFQEYMNTGAYARERDRTTTRILAQMNQNAQEHHARFMLVHLAWGALLKPIPKPNRYEPDWSEEWGSKDAAELHIPFLPTRPQFLNAAKPWTEGHYTEAEARLVADAVDKAILALLSD